MVAVLELTIPSMSALDRLAGRKIGATEGRVDVAAH